MNPTSFFCMWITNCSSTTSLFNRKLKRLFSLLGAFVEKQLAIHVCIYFWTLSSSPLICPMPHCLDYFICIYSFVFIVSFTSCLKFSDSLLSGSSCILFGESQQRPEAQGSFSLNETGVINNLSQFLKQLYCEQNLRKTTHMKRI